MSLYRPRKRRAEINIVPLIDLMTVLIFFFLMTMRFDELQSLSIVPPTTESTGHNFAKGAGEDVIGITRSGRLYLNGKEVERETLLRHLEEVGKKFPGRGVFVIADEYTYHKDTMHIVSWAAKVGLAPRIDTRASR
jgi:biopolymer transport protein ExbD